MKKSQFAITRDLFATYIDYNGPLSYAEWRDIADEHKAAALFCQFYDEITLAWYKIKSPYSTEEDGVAETLQYLQKNVDIIASDATRFDAKYIYRIIYNCLYCLCKDPNRYKAAFENEISNITYGPDGDELDLFDLAPSYDDYSNINYLRDKIWDILDREVKRRYAEDPNKGKAFAIVVSELFGDNLDFTGLYHKFDFKPAENEEMKEYKKSEEISFKNLPSKKASIISKYGSDLKSDITEVVIIRNGKEVVKLEYTVREARPYKGMQEFTKCEKDSVSDEDRDAITAYLRKILAPIQAAFC